MTQNYEHFSQYPYECPKCSYLTLDSTVSLYEKSQWGGNELTRCCKLCWRYKGHKVKVLTRQVGDIRGYD